MGLLFSLSTMFLKAKQKADEGGWTSDRSAAREADRGLEAEADQKPPHRTGRALTRRRSARSKDLSVWKSQGSRRRTLAADLRP